MVIVRIGVRAITVRNCPRARAHHEAAGQPYLFHPTIMGLTSDLTPLDFKHSSPESSGGAMSYTRHNVYYLETVVLVVGALPANQ